MNNKCPFCGSEDVTLTVQIPIEGKLNKDGSIEISKYWHEYQMLELNMQKVSCHDKYAYCNHCKRDVGFDNYVGYTEEMD